MKRHFTLVSALVAMSAMSQTLSYGPQEITDIILNHISSNGIWAAGSDEQDIMNIINLVTNERWDYGESYGTQSAWLGMGHSVSDNGIIVGDGYWADGSWKKLPMRPRDVGCMANSITPDSKYIAGSIHRAMMDLDFDGLLSVPVLWTQSDDGASYQSYLELPYPTKDWTGRRPQSILVDDISADGRTIIADLVDYSGFVHEPLLYTLSDEGEWSYEILHPELLNPDALVFPSYPGESPNPPDPKAYMSSAEYMLYQESLDAYSSRLYPQPQDFMSEDTYAQYLVDLDLYYSDPNYPYPDIYNYLTDEELAAYQNALESYWDVPYPDPQDFMTPEEAALYESDMASYEQTIQGWSVEYEKFIDVYYEVLGNCDVPSFSQNSARISPNGRYVIFTADIMYPDPNSIIGFGVYTAPYLFDLVDGTYSVLDQGVPDVYATQVNDEGWVLGGSPVSMYTRDAVIAKGMDAPFESIASEIEKNNPELYTWMDQRMSHPFMRMGTPVANSDYTIFVTWNYNSWDFNPAAPYYYSYIIPSEYKFNGITSIEKDIDAQPISYFDLQGRHISDDYNALRPGMYITSDHRKVVVR